MKSKLLFFTCVLCLNLSFAQLNVWTGTEDDLWSNENNWSGTVPTASDDVLIPTGYVVTVDTPANIRSIEVEGNSVLNVTETITILNPSEFEMNVEVNWISGDLIGPGILLNSGTINLSFPSFDLSGSVVLNNPGTINLIGGSIGINTQSVLNNSGTGVIDFQVSGSSISASGVPPNTLNNFGTIRTSFPDPADSGAIGGTIINTDGVFQIDSGTLSLNTTANNFMSGQFNVASGATLNWNGPIDAMGTLSGAVFGDLNWNNDFSVSGAAVFDFSGNGVINNTGGDLVGGGTLTNLSTINFVSGTAFLDGMTTLENSGQLLLASSGDVRLGAGSTLNNLASGLIDFQVNGAEIASFGVPDNTRIFNNSGSISINLPLDTDACSIGIIFNNNDGLIDVNNGTLNFSFTGTSLVDGTYNIGVNGQLGWLFPIAMSGTLNGALDGSINWSSDIVVSGTASLDFTGSGFIDWISGDLDGGGTLNNQVTIIKTAGGSKRIENGTTLNNNGELTQIVGGTISITTNSVLNNNASGTLLLEASSSGFSGIGVAPNTLNNFGLIESDVDNNFTVMSVQVSNSGTIDVVQNGMTFSGFGALTNNPNGVIEGEGTITLPAGFMNNGVIAPGNSPGTLSFLNDYTSGATAILELELNGGDQGVTYDLLAIDGDADLEGGLSVDLGFNPSVNDEFIVLTTQIPNTINSCNLPASISASFGGFDYEFDVVCRNNNELVLTVIDETLSTENFDLANNSISLFPNPTADHVTIKTDLQLDSVSIFDMNGKLILKTNETLLDLTQLRQGLYVVSIQVLNGEIIHKKLVKK